MRQVEGNLGSPDSVDLCLELCNFKVNVLFTKACPWFVESSSLLVMTFF